MRSFELFAGAGGLAMGIGKAGFVHDAVVEWDRHAFETMLENQSRGVLAADRSRLIREDVRTLSYSRFSPPIDLLSGGPPCQPFSLGGKHKGHADTRDMFPEMVRATSELQPKAILIENVKGLLRPSFSEYLRYILLHLSYPEVLRRPDEQWHEHFVRIEQHGRHDRQSGLSYKLALRVLNAADYGIPQKRERVFIVGFRADCLIDWQFPAPSHSQAALLWSQWITGDYWDQLEIPQSDRPSLSASQTASLEKLRGRLFPPLESPWVTVRQAIADLPNPMDNVGSTGVPNHTFNPGARVYKGHTGSLLDAPAKTLKAGDHGVPGGENMVVLPSGEVRYFTVRESARLQTFPDNYLFHGSWTENMRQLGNAVPVKLAATIASTIHTFLAPVRESEAVLVEA
jgi:DNA (cytosine-5)-methyltransferase 1